jgi:recA bacterial DNA recombination protein
MRSSAERSTTPFFSDMPGAVPGAPTCRRPNRRFATPLWWRTTLCSTVFTPEGTSVQEIVAVRRRRPGGRALRFYASVHVELCPGAALHHLGVVAGRRVRAVTVKNGVAPPFRGVELALLYGRVSSAPIKRKTSPECCRAA